jgi:hypothetical protein
MTPVEVTKFLNEINRTIYVTGDTWNFKNMLDVLKDKYPNFKEILNYQIKPTDKLQIFVDDYKTIDRNFVTAENLIQLDIMDLLIEYGMD